MTWNPKYNLLPVATFRDNLLASLQANFQDALEWACDQCGVSPVLPQPSSFNTDRALRQHYPVLNVLMMGGDPEWSPGGELNESKRILIEAETQAETGDDLVKVLEPYVLAMKSVATEMGEADWMRRIDPSTRGDLLVSVGSERYGDRQYDSEGTFTRVGSVVVTIQYLEAERS